MLTPIRFAGAMSAFVAAYSVGKYGIPVACHPVSPGPLMSRMPANDNGARQLTMSQVEKSQADELSSAREPLGLFSEWFEEARRLEPNDPDAMALATVDAQGLPNVRMVLLKSFDARGFVFYTNLESRKGMELSSNPKAALCFHWKSLLRQIRIRGPVEAVSAAEADSYFASRPRLSQIGAWASRQSRPLEGPFALEKSVAKSTARFAVGKVPRPDFWSGFRVVPEIIEFWQDRPFRLHRRLVFTRGASEGEWTATRLYP
jgi:pyridoxamine 5'-phosphate oxidase